MDIKLKTLDEMLKDTDEEKKEEEKKEEEPKKEEKKEKKEEEEEEEEKKEEEKKEEKKKEEEPKKEEPKEEEPKEEEKKEEEKKEEEEPKKEEPKEEEKKEEEEPKKEEKKEVKKEDKKEDEEGPKVEIKEPPKPPREPEPKIPSNFKPQIEELKQLKAEGNNLIKTELDKAIEKYEEAYKKSSELIPKAYKEKEYNEEQSLEIILLHKQIMSNLSLSYQKKEEYQKSIDLDLKIISSDPHYDKSYARLFSNYMKLGKPNIAVYYGTLLKKNFSEETKEKYKELIPQINEEELKFQKEIDEFKAKQRSETIKSIMKYAIPILILVVAVLIYLFVFKKNSPINLGENATGNFTRNLTDKGNASQVNTTLNNEADID